MGIAEKLEAAADNLEENGHAKYVRTYNGAKCILGALAWAENCNPHEGCQYLYHLTTPVYDFLFPKPVSYIGDSQYQRAVSLVSWNNAEERTKADVVSALRDTAKALRNRNKKYLEITKAVVEEGR
jgi:hypothetical protein